MKAPFVDSAVRFVGSKTFFRLTIGLLVFESLWIALTARYPQAFDEQVHFGLIQLHAHSWLPFFTNQPPTADAYGAVVRDPSYLYHYVLSFPYRIIELFTHDETIQIILLRCLNIGLFVSALPLFQRIGRRLGLSAASTQLGLFVFVILPVIPLLASQINYYNMLTPLTALLAWLLLRLQADWRAKHAIPWWTVWAILMVSLLGSIVHYPFLPLATAAVIYAAVALWRQRLRIRRPAVRWRPVVALVVLLLSFGLFSERYVINLVRYHTPTPECDQVLSVKECQSYSPWLRNYYFAAQNDKPSKEDVLEYPGSWFGRVIEESLFAIGSGFNSGINISRNQYGQVDYWGARSLPVPRFIMIGVLIVGLGASLATGRKLAANRQLRLVMMLTVSSAGVLFLLNFSDFLHVGAIVGVHGRYLVPVMPFVLMLLALAFRELVPRRPLALASTALIIVFALQGGGLLTYIDRSQTRWFWPQSTAAQRANQQVQRVIWPLMIGSGSDK